MNYARTAALVRRPSRPAFAIGMAVLTVLLSLSIMRMFSNDPGTSSLKSDVSGRPLSELSPDDVVLLDSSANVFDESNFSGRVYLLAFYDKDCGGCKSRESELKKLKGKYLKSPMQLVFLNTGSGDYEAFQAEARKKKDTRLFDQGKRFSNAMGISTLPAIMIIDHEGIIRYSAQDDDFDDSELGAQLDSAIVRVPVVEEEQKQSKGKR